MSSSTSRGIVFRAIRYAVAIVLIAYAAWELYWCSQVRLTFIRWHTHLMVYVYLLYGGYIIYSLIRQPTERQRNAFTAYMALLFTLLIAEGLLTVSGIYATYTESRVGYYISPYGSPNNIRYNTWPPGKTHLLTTPEYTYPRPTNSLGFADSEWPQSKKPGEKRILAFGDSFTEGDGAPYDSSYVALLRRCLDSTYYIMNAGTCGSDPVNNYVNLRDHLLPYHPDIVIQSLSSDDICTDIRLRGGADRAVGYHVWSGNHAPRWEPLYAVSYISRVFFRAAGYSHLLRRNEMTAAEKAQVYATVDTLFGRYAALCREQGIRLYIVIHPGREEIGDSAYTIDMNPVVQHLTADTNVKVIDLLPLYRSYIADHHSAAKDYFWRYDGHHNSRGYEMMAKTTLEGMMPYME